MEDSMTTFDPTKPVQTRDGNKARIICSDRLAGQSVVALIEHCGSEIIAWFYANGRSNSDNIDRPGDLVNVPEKHVRWVALYRAPDGSFHATLHKSREAAVNHGAISVRVVEFEEGKFDD